MHEILERPPISIGRQVAVKIENYLIRSAVNTIYPWKLRQFTRSTEARSLDPDTNLRATDLVINAVAKHPQESTGASTIIADRLLDEFDPPPGLETSVGIREMSQILPDGEYCKDQINRIHSVYHIPVRVRRGESGAIIASVASGALHKIKTTTMDEAYKLGINIPEAMQEGTR